MSTACRTVCATAAADDLLVFFLSNDSFLFNMKCNVDKRCSLKLLSFRPMIMGED
jgi:hypothetical protein